MSHLEDLLCEWYDWRGYVVKRNVKVGRLDHGGWEGELDIVAYNPTTGELVHVEPSIDSDPWSERQKRFAKKFNSGQKHVHTQVFPWVDGLPHLRQIAVLISRGKRKTLEGGELATIDEIVSRIRKDVIEEGKMAGGAIPEQYPLLRTVQLFVNGYRRGP